MAGWLSVIGALTRLREGHEMGQWTINEQAGHAEINRLRMMGICNSFANAPHPLPICRDQ